MDEKTEYLFCINTGRSGSEYLSNLFTHVSGCRSFHEPEPTGNGEVMRHYARGRLEPMREFSRKKFNMIKELKRGYQTYVETNHCFLKGFGWFIPEYLPQDRIGVIILKRESTKIAQSYLRIGCSPLVPYGRIWLSTPDMKFPLVPPPRILISPGTTYQFFRLIKFLVRGINFLIRMIFGNGLQYHPQWLINYELECLEWYVDETHERTVAFKLQYPKIKYFETDIADLNSYESVQKMLMFFGLEGKESLDSVVGKPTNLFQADGEPGETGSAQQ